MELYIITKNPLCTRGLEIHENKKDNVKADKSGGMDETCAEWYVTIEAGTMAEAIKKASETYNAPECAFVAAPAGNPENPADDSIVKYLKEKMQEESSDPVSDDSADYFGYLTEVTIPQEGARVCLLAKRFSNWTGSTSGKIRKYDPETENTVLKMDDGKVLVNAIPNLYRIIHEPEEMPENVYWTGNRSDDILIRQNLAALSAAGIRIYVSESGKYFLRY